MIISSETHKPTKAILGFEPPSLLLLVYFHCLHLFLDFSLHISLYGDLYSPLDLFLGATLLMNLAPTS